MSMRETAYNENDLIKARQALSLLKIQKARGSTMVQKIEGQNIAENTTKENNKNMHKSKSNLKHCSNEDRYKENQKTKKMEIDPYDRPIRKQANKIIESKPKPTAYDERDSRPIKPNNNNMEKLEIQESLKSCPKEKCPYCNRMFNLKSLEKHQKVCQERPDKKKRKVFDSKKVRIIEEEQNNLKSSSSKVNPKKSSNKIPKWKLQSEQLRNVLKSMKVEDNSNGSQVPIKEYPSYIQCPTCGRSFNEDAAKRHIPICGNKARSDAMRNKGKVSARNRFNKKL